MNVFCLQEEPRDVEGAEADDREPFRTIAVELVLTQWKREHEGRPFLFGAGGCLPVWHGVGRFTINLSSSATWPGADQKKRWPDVYKTVRGDVWPSLLKGFDLARVLYDGRDHGGTAETYLSKLQGPMGIIDQPQNLLQLQDEGLDVPFLDAQLKLDPDRRLLSIYIIREIISKRSKEHALSRTRRVSYNTDQKTGR